MTQKKILSFETTQCYEL